MVRRNSTFISIDTQARSLNRDRKGTCRVTGHKSLDWEGWITPGPLSDRYRVRMTYHLGYDPDVEVLSPKLILAKGKDVVPHMYYQKYLCLHFPKNKEWTPQRFLSKTIIPWVSDWLYHYESWLVTGEWQGGGIEHH